MSIRFCGTDDEEVELVFSLKEIKVRKWVGMVRVEGVTQRIAVCVGRGGGGAQVLIVFMFFETIGPRVSVEVDLVSRNIPRPILVSKPESCSTRGRHARAFRVR